MAKDPSAIDYPHLLDLAAEHAKELEAIVEALREQIAELKIEKQGGWECLLKRAEAVEARVVELARAVRSIRGYFTVIRRKVREHPPSVLISETVDTLATEALAKLDALDKKEKKS